MKKTETELPADNQLDFIAKLVDLDTRRKRGEDISDAPEELRKALDTMYEIIEHLHS